MDVLLECVDLRGRQIVLTGERWFDHVLPDHPIVRGREIMVPVVVAAPDIVTRDADWPNRRCFSRRRILPDVPHLYVKVVMEVASEPDDGGDGRIITVYPTSCIKRREDPLWP